MYDDEMSPFFRKKNKGLSTGGIIAIIISCCVVLLVVVIMVTIFRKPKNLVEKVYPENTSSFKIVDLSTIH